jgi:hypothetical protein
MQRSQRDTTPVLDLLGELADEFLTMAREVGGGPTDALCEETADVARTATPGGGSDAPAARSRTDRLR